MIDDRNRAAEQPDPGRTPAASPARRRLLKAGLIATTVPVVMTIKGRPAWAKCTPKHPENCTTKDLRKLSAKMFPSRATKK